MKIVANKDFDYADISLKAGQQYDIPVGDARGLIDIGFVSQVKDPVPANPSADNEQQ